MLEFGSQKLTELRLRIPDAGGLVIAPSIEMAEYMTRLLAQIEGETPVLVHSQMANPDGKIKAFRNTNKRWLGQMHLAPGNKLLARMHAIED